MKALTTLMMTATLTIGALATGCQTTTNVTPATSHAHPQITTHPLTNAALQANDWQLIDAMDNNGNKVTDLFIDPAKPLTLSFNKIDNHDMVSFINTCNNISSAYTVSDNKLKLGNIMSTMMACPDAEAKFDAATVATAMGNYTLSEDTNKHPMLVISSEKQVAHFKAVPKSK